MRIDRERIAALAAKPDDELWREVVSIATQHGISLPKQTPPHADLERLRQAVSGEKIKLGEAMRLLNEYKRGMGK